MGLKFHVVATGDSVHSIATKYRVEPSLIRAANGIVGDKVYRGARVLLEHPNPSYLRSSTVSTPAAVAMVQSVTPANVRPNGTYTIVAGDTLGGIAKKLKVTLAALLTVNRMTTTSMIFPGRTLRIPPTQTTSPTTTAVRPRVSPTTTVRPTPALRSYTVVAGDTLSGIAKKARVRLADLLTTNRLTMTSMIRPGQKLRLPAAVVSAPRPTPTTVAPRTPTTTVNVTSRVSYTSVLPRLACPVAKAKFMNDWGFPRGSTRFHEGTDLFAPTGTPITAPAAGTVKFGQNTLGGVTFNLTTDDGWVVYGAHLSSVANVTGRVKAGTVLGTVGTSGDAAGGPPHLHMGIRPVRGRVMNPYPLMRSACV